MTDDEERIKAAARMAFGDEADLFDITVVGSGSSETIVASPKRGGRPVTEMRRFIAPWTENSGLIAKLFEEAGEKSSICPGRDCEQCCQAQAGASCRPLWREHEDPEWYAQEIMKLLAQVNRRIAEGGPFAASLAADEAFALGRLLTEALLKFNWDEDVKRGMKVHAGATGGGERRRSANPKRRSIDETVADVDALRKNGVPCMQAYKRVAKEQNIKADTVGKEYRREKNRGRSGQIPLKD